jgi:hypothetical protein
MSKSVSSSLRVFPDGSTYRMVRVLRSIMRATQCCPVFIGMNMCRRVIAARGPVTRFPAAFRFREVISSCIVAGGVHCPETF